MSARAGLRGALLIWLAGLALALGPSPAAAHASLVSSTPAQGARLDALPEQVRLEFSDAVLAPAYVVITGPDGRSATRGEPEVQGAVVTQATAGGPAGGYTLAYRAVSEDGHVVTGQIGFAVGEGASVPSAAADPATEEAEPEEEESETEARQDAAQEAAGDGPDRDTIAVLVGAALFAGAGLLLLASRRSP